jgi:ubiquinone biosynthesis protein
VHHAVTADGEKVAVKIQRPGIRKIIEVDLEILLHMATLMERHIEEMALYRPVKIVEEFARILEKELDYTIEAGSMERVASAYLDNQTVYIPKVYSELTSSRVLTMEYVQGIKISEVAELDAAGLDRAQITKRGAQFYLKQIFGDGFFHADPHPGNILVLPENVICLLDYGMMGSINDRTREDFVDLVDGVVHRRPERTVRVLLQLTEWDHEPDINALEKDALDFMDRHLYKPLKDIEIGKVLNQLLDLASHHQLRIPRTPSS